jgi:GrpB-like predicted nucleotidyltransferase (UPF0157 family)
VRVVVVDYDSGWPQLFQYLSHRWRALLGERVVAIDHVGSTAVPGLCAKPRIDAVIVVRQAPDIPGAAGLLETAGYVSRGDRYNDGMWALLSAADMPQQRIYVCAPGNHTHGKFVLFRDYLRTHPEAAADYAALKRRLAATYAEDGDAYTKAKSGFIMQAVAAAELERV